MICPRCENLYWYAQKMRQIIVPKCCLDEELLCRSNATNACSVQGLFFPVRIAVEIVTLPHSNTPTVTLQMCVSPRSIDHPELSGHSLRKLPTVVQYSTVQYRNVHQPLADKAIVDG